MMNNRRNFQNNLDFVIASEDGYGSNYIGAAVTYGDFITDLRNTIASNDQRKYHCISNKMKTSVRETSQFIMFLDCDNENNLWSALKVLDDQNIVTQIVVSSFRKSNSDKRFWIICDFISEGGNVIDKTHTIPGVDFRYLKCAKRKGSMVLRAHPHKQSLPVFIYDRRFLRGSSLFQDYVNDLYAYWYSDDMRRIIQTLIAQDSSWLNTWGDVSNIGRDFCVENYEEIQSMVNANCVRRQDNEIELIKVNDCISGLEADTI